MNQKLLKYYNNLLVWWYYIKLGMKGINYIHSTRLEAYLDKQYFYEKNYFFYEDK